MTNIRSIIFAYLIILFCKMHIVVSEVSCKDSNGRSVDWFIVYKLPTIEASSDPMEKFGTAFYYLDVNNQAWMHSPVSINETKNNAVYYTLKQIYDNVRSQDILYLLYNDESLPVKKSYSTAHGHTKGDLAFDNQGGFWLVHSVPKFPPLAKDRYSYPWTGKLYGQSFLCISLPYSQLETVGTQLLYNYPLIYDSNVPRSFITRTPILGDVIANKTIKSAPWNNTATLATSGKQTFVSFAKFTKFGKDLYRDWLAPALQSSFYVETWQHGNDKVLSTCSPYKVLNVKNSRFKQIVNDASFTEMEDHSKWAVALQSSSKPWICIGDINRMESQFKRAGGTVCAQLTKVWQAFNSIIVNFEQCEA